MALRIYSENDAQRFATEKNLELALICLKSSFLEKQFFGAKIVNFIENKSRQEMTVIDNSYMAELLNESKVFNIIIKGHHSLILKAKGILRLLFG